MSKELKYTRKTQATCNRVQTAAVGALAIMRYAGPAEQGSGAWWLLYNALQAELGLSEDELNALITQYAENER